jgi:hypothetical protein
VFTARYELMPYIKQITFRLLKVKTILPCCVSSTLTSAQLNKFLNIPTKCISLLLKHVSITSLLHAPVCYIHHQQGEPGIYKTHQNKYERCNRVILVNEGVNLVGMLNKGV